jgi:hypothetical protein
VAVLSDLVSRVRVELGDIAKQFTWDGKGDGSKKAFYVDVKPVDQSTLSVRVNGSAIAYPTGYTLEKDYGVIHFTTEPDYNALIHVEGSHFRYFADSDIETFVGTAVTQHTHNRTDSYGRALTVARLDPVEEYPLIILASIEALWALATDSAFDININAPDGVMIPRAQRFTQLTQIINQRWDQYKQLSAALNIGLWRIEMGTLRRVSRTTNKLIPVYMAQEVDDSRRPERVYLTNELNGRTPTPSNIGTYDIILSQGDSWYGIFDFPNDTNFDDLVFKAQIRTYPNSPSLWAEFNITVENASLKKLRLSLTKKQTENMPVRAFWDIQATSLSDPDFEQTYIRGQVFADSQVTQ